MDAIRQSVSLAIREPITASEYAAKLAEAREEWVPVEDLADFLVGQRAGWNPEDFEETEGEWGPLVKEESWDQALAEEERRLRDLAAKGKLPSRGRGKSLKLKEACLEDFGHSLGLVPEGSYTYRVVPDDQAEEVERERKALAMLRTALDWQDYKEEEGSDPVNLRVKVLEGLKMTIAHDLISAWIQTRCIDVVLGDIGEAFNGTDPLKPVFRTKLEETRTNLQSIREHLLELVKMDVVLREPLGEEMEEMREWVASIPNP